MERFGDRLTRLMKEARLKNPDIARVTGKDHTTVSKWRGNNQVPPDGSLAEIVDLFRARGVQTTVHELRHGTPDPRQASEPRASYAVGHVEFTTITAQQRARVWLENFLLELAEAGADHPFLDETRRLLLNPDNYGPGFADGPMSDDGKLRHMQALASGLRESLKDRLKTRRLPDRLPLREPPGLQERSRKRGR